MALSEGIAATIAVIVVVVVVAVGLAVYCLWWRDSDDSSTTKTTEIVTSSSSNNVINNGNLYTPSAAAAANNSNIIVNSRFSNNNNNNNLSPLSTTSSQQQIPAMFLNSSQSRVSSVLNTGRGGSTTVSSMKQSNFSDNNNKSTIILNSYLENDAGFPSSISIIPIVENNQIKSASSRLEHIPVNQRITDGTRLYYTFVQDHEQHALTKAVSNTEAAATEVELYLKKGKVLTAKKIQKKLKEIATTATASAVNDNSKVAEVFELNLNDVGLGSESNQYVAFALLCELAAKHLPDQCEWEEGQAPPLRLASVDLEEARKTFSPDLVVGSNVISVVDAEALVANVEAVRDTAHDPLVLMIVEPHAQRNRPGSVPTPWKVMSSLISSKQKHEQNKKSSIKNDDRRRKRKHDHQSESETEDEEHNDNAEEVLHRSYHDAEQDISVDVSGIYSPRRLKKIQKKMLNANKKKSSHKRHSSSSSSENSSSHSSSVSFSVQRPTSASGEFRQTVSFDLSPEHTRHQHQNHHSATTTSRSTSSPPLAKNQNNNSKKLATSMIGQQPYFPTLTVNHQSYLQHHHHHQQSSRGPSITSHTSSASSARGSSLTAATNMTNVSSRTPFFSHQYSAEAMPTMVMPLLAPRIYPYSPVVTTRTPIRITGVQYRCKRTGVFIQDRWKIFALDDCLSKLPGEFMQLVAFMSHDKDEKAALEMKRQQQHQQRAIKKMINKKNHSSKKKRGSDYSNFDDDDDDDENETSDDSSSSDDESDYTTSSDVLNALGATQKPTNRDNSFVTSNSLLNACLPKTFEFSSRKSTAAKTSSLHLPHLSVTAARDGSLFVKSTPRAPDAVTTTSSSLKKKKSKRSSIDANAKKKEVTLQLDNNNNNTHDIKVNSRPAPPASESGDSSSQYSSYNQSSIQLIHVEVVPMSFSYNIEGGLSNNNNNNNNNGGNDGGISVAAHNPWCVVECMDDIVEGQNELNNIRFQKEQSTLARIVSSSSSSPSKEFQRQQQGLSPTTREFPAAFTTVFLPLGRICVMARTRDENSRKLGKNDPSWSTVFTVNASTKEDTRDYSEYAALHFAGI